MGRRIFGIYTPTAVHPPNEYAMYRTGVDVLEAYRYSGPFDMKRLEEVRVHDTRMGRCVS